MVVAGVGTTVYDCVWWARYSKEHHCEAVSRRTETVITYIDVGSSTEINGIWMHQPVLIPQENQVEHVTFACDGGEKIER